jgi:hypothetical protein
MILIEPYRPEHMESLRIQPAQARFVPLMADRGYCEALAHAGPAFAAVQDGATIAIGGCVEQSPGRAIAWALLAKTDGVAFIKVHRAVTRWLEIAPWRRIEAAVESDFAAGHRWIKMLGFTHEGRMRGYTPEGGDCDLYARVR